MPDCVCHASVWSTLLDVLLDAKHVVLLRVKQPVIETQDLVTWPEIN